MTQQAREVTTADGLVLALLPSLDRDAVCRALARGAAAVAALDSSPTHLALVRHLAEQGGVVLPRAVAVSMAIAVGQLVHPVGPDASAILVRMASGHSTREIAEGLHLSERTVRRRVERLLRDLGVTSRAQAVIVARDRGLLTVSGLPAH